MNQRYRIAERVKNRQALARIEGGLNRISRAVKSDAKESGIRQAIEWLQYVDQGLAIQMDHDLAVLNGLIDAPMVHPLPTFTGAAKLDPRDQPVPDVTE